MIALALLALAPTYECARAECVAQNFDRNGDPVFRSFREGDLIDTEGGWIIPEHGWVRVDSRSLFHLDIGETYGVASLVGVQLREVTQ